MHSDGGIALSVQLESKSDEDDTQSLRDQGKGSESRTFDLTSDGDNDAGIALNAVVVGPESRARDMMHYDDNNAGIALTAVVVGPESRAHGMMRTRHDGNDAETAFAEPLVHDGENDFGSISIETTSATNLTNKMVRLRGSAAVFAYVFNNWRSRCNIYSAKRVHFTLVTNRRLCSAYRSHKTN